MKFRYCPKCRTKLAEATARHVSCGRCDFDFYINPGPTSCVILETGDGEILLVKRKHAPYKGWWDLPGGFVEFYESITEAACREIKEEIAVKLREEGLQYVGSYPDRYLHRGYNYHTLAFVFAAKLHTRKFRPADDVSEAVLFLKNAVPINRVAFKGMRAALRDYLSRSKPRYSSRM